MKNLLSKLRETMPLPLKNQGKFLSFFFEAEDVVNTITLGLVSWEITSLFYTNNRTHWIYIPLSSRRYDNENRVPQASTAVLWPSSRGLPYWPCQSRAWIHCHAVESTVPGVANKKELETWPLPVRSLWPIGGCRHDWLNKSLAIGDWNVFSSFPSPEVGSGTESSTPLITELFS